MEQFQNIIDMMQVDDFMFPHLVVQSCKENQDVHYRIETTLSSSDQIQLYWSYMTSQALRIETVEQRHTDRQKVVQTERLTVRQTDGQ